MLDQEDPRPLVTQDMLAAGVEELRTTGMMRPGADEDYARMMVAVSRVYSRMRKLEPARLLPKKLHVIGGL